MEKKKYLTLSAGIMSTVVLSILAILYLVDGAVLLDSLNYGFDDYAGVIRTVGIICIVISIIEFVAVGLNGASIVAYKPEKRNKLKATLITAVVFNFVIVLLNIIIFISAVATWLIIIGIILVLALICANVLYIIDLARKDVPKSNKSVDGKKVVGKQELSKEEQLLSELEKLVSLRERHILTQEEFDKIKAQVIARHISE